MHDTFSVIENRFIPLNDGRALAARIWMPNNADTQPVPAILEYLPYRKRDATAAARDDHNLPRFAKAGYAVIRTDITGTGESDGHMTDEYSETEINDGTLVIAWIAKQPWCNGNVGMMGISWGGFNGLQIAAKNPPALKAVVSVGTIADRYTEDCHYSWGGLHTVNFTWSAELLARMTRPPDPPLRKDWRDVWLDRLENMTLMALEWHRHQKRDDYWRRASPCQEWNKIRAPILAVGGLADLYKEAPTRLLEHIRSPIAAWLGPWEHKYPDTAKVGPTGDFFGEARAWFDRFLRDGADSHDLPALRAYLVRRGDSVSSEWQERPGRWVKEDVWPSPHIKDVAFALGADGTLFPAADGDGAVNVNGDNNTAAVNVSDNGDGDGAAGDNAGAAGDNDGAVNVPFSVPAGDNDNTVNVSDDGDSDGAVNVANDDGVVNFPPASGGANGIKPGELTIRTPQDHGLKSGTLIPGMRQQNELPGEQRMEDTLCTCFDTAPASEDADLLGTPILEFTFSADKPVALVTVRLCEVAPDGSSERILWRAFNLTHHPALNAMDGDTGYNGLNGREYEKALEPGEQYRVRLPLGVIARTITRGNRLRLALATTYWPMEWPAPEAFTLKIAPSLCRLTLPLRRPRAQDEITMPAPRDEITSRWRKLEDGESTRITGADKEGRTQVEWNDKFPTLQSEDHHLVIAQEVSETYLVGDDPASAEIVVRWTTRNAREKEFETRVESWHRMTCDTRNFRLRAGFNAFLNGRKFHSREWDETIPRELL